jgi:malonyl-CoA O-methyltransferase
MEVKRGIRRNFARRVASYDQHAAAQRFMARRLLALAAAAAPRPGRILEVGCGTGHLTARLRREHPGAGLTALDLAPALVAAARERLGPNEGVAWVVADAETWSRGAFDLIISNAAFQWLTSPGEALAAYFQCLNPGGVLAFSTLGPLTFRELSASLREAEARLGARRVPEIPAQKFLTREGWAALLGAAGFSQVSLERRLITAAYPTVRQFLKSLQATGATNPDPRPFSSRLLKAMTAAYEEGFRHNGAVPVTYEIIWAVARRQGRKKVPI